MNSNGHPSSAPTTSPAGTARATPPSTRSAASRSTSSRASSSPSWGPRARASRRSCTSSRRSTSRRAARSRIAGEDVGALSDTDVTLLRRKHIGFVFQFFNLLPMLTAEENIAPAALDRGREARQGLLRGPDEARRPRRPPQAPSRRALRRPAAARRDRTLARLAADRRLRRRADGQPRLARRAGDPRRCCAPRARSTARRP